MYILPPLVHHIRHHIPDLVGEEVNQTITLTSITPPHTTITLTQEDDNIKLTHHTTQDDTTSFIRQVKTVHHINLFDPYCLNKILRIIENLLCQTHPKYPGITNWKP